MPKLPSTHIIPCACGKALSSVRASKVVAVDPAIKQANLHRLRRIEGQVRGVLGMIEGDRSCPETVTQIAAIRESLQALSKNLLRNHLDHCASAAIRAGGKGADDMLDELVDLVGKIAR